MESGGSHSREGGPGHFKRNHGNGTKGHARHQNIDCVSAFSCFLLALLWLHLESTNQPKTGPKRRRSAPTFLSTQFPRTSQMKENHFIGVCGTSHGETVAAHVKQKGPDVSDPTQDRHPPDERLPGAGGGNSAAALGIAPGTSGGPIWIWSSSANAIYSWHSEARRDVWIENSVMLAAGGDLREHFLWGRAIRWSWLVRTGRRTTTGGGLAAG